MSELQLLDIKRVAELFLVSEKTVRRLVDRGELGCIRIGQQIRFTQDHVRDYMKDALALAGDRDDDDEWK